MKKRLGQRDRVTTETSVRLSMGLDGPTRYKVHTTIPFLDHMLELFAKHGNFFLEVDATGGYSHR
jgi:imidazoleglycerol-phosphate dehydratase